MQGYTGHCPTLKFRFGKPYGANTKEAIQELRETPPRPEPYRHNDPHKTVLVPITCEKVQTEDYDSHLNRKSQRYILGYTGYIPGLHFRYGNSFQRAAYESFIDFGRRLAEEDQRREREKRSYRSQSAPRTRIRSRESVKKTLDQACPKHKSYNCSHISAEFPPIAGYTGHIPRLRVTDTALSQRYGTAVRQGLTLLQQEREKRGRN